MPDLRSMSYDEFGKLRFLDFFPKTTKTASYYFDDSGGMECPVGLTDYEGYGPSAGFMSKRGNTCMIDLPFYNGCPEPGAYALLDSLCLEIRKGMSDAQVKHLLGNPEREIHPGWPRFVLGKKWPYYIGCYIDKRSGLAQITIYRKDLANKEARLTG
jgi:hypothetical protein